MTKTCAHFVMAVSGLVCQIKHPSPEDCPWCEIERLQAERDKYAKIAWDLVPQPGQPPSHEPSEGLRQALRRMECQKICPKCGQDPYDGHDMCSEPAPTSHTTEENYHHFLAYSNLPPSAALRWAFYAGADETVPGKAGEPRIENLTDATQSGPFVSMEPSRSDDLLLAFTMNADGSATGGQPDPKMERCLKALETIAAADPLSPRGLLQEVAREALES